MAGSKPNRSRAVKRLMRPSRKRSAKTGQSFARLSRQSRPRQANGPARTALTEGGRKGGGSGAEHFRPTSAPLDLSAKPKRISKPFKSSHLQTHKKRLPKGGRKC